VRGRIAISDGAVAGPRKNVALAYDHAANWHLTARSRRPGFLNGGFHE
jgi:hypothetical protein